MDTLCSRPQPTFYSNVYSDSSVSSPYQLFSYPPANGEPVDAAFYWFGQFIFVVETLASWTLALAPTYCAFFDDTDPTYRVLVRRNEVAGFSGTSTTRSFMFSYDSLLTRSCCITRPHRDHTPYYRIPRYASGTNIPRKYLGPALPQPIVGKGGFLGKKEQQVQQLIQGALCSTLMLVKYI